MSVNLIYFTVHLRSIPRHMSHSLEAAQPRRAWRVATVLKPYLEKPDTARSGNQAQQKVLLLVSTRTKRLFNFY